LWTIDGDQGDGLCYRNRDTWQHPPAMTETPHYQPLLHVVLHQPEIPHNTGSVGRTCVAAGAKLWLVRPLGFRVDDYYLRRAGLDYWQYLEWEAVDDWKALVERLPARRPWFFTKTAERSYAEVAFAQDDVLVFGSESQGLPPSLLEQNAERLLRIPIRPQARSLNLSNAVGIVVFEALRQFGQRNTKADGHRDHRGH
jgi:tRNA (cytidine/uridine-2'-O-)-methyltransferase